MNWKKRDNKVPKAVEYSGSDFKTAMISDEEKYGEEELSHVYDDFIYEQLRERQIFKNGEDE
jgi:hypothetical protein